MKTTEEKAIAYDGIIARANKMYNENIDTCKACIEELIPELAESENEKIRKGIESIIKHYRDEGEVVCPYPFVTIEKALDWLEKQGKQNPVIIPKFRIGDVVRHIPNKVNMSQVEYRITRIDDKFYYSKFEDGDEFVLFGFPVEDTWELVKPKLTAEEVLIKAGLKPYKDGNQWCILVGDNIQEGVCGFGDTIEDALYEFLKELVQVKQKPIEWSEEEEIYIRELENLVRERWAKAEVEKDKFWIKKMSDLSFFLKTIKKYYQKSEWSEEDIERYKSCLKRLGTGNPEQPETINSKWFKEHVYLRPKQEWSEEDRNKIADYLYCLNVGFTQAAAKQRAKDICDLFCPKKQWKPSKEQMEALDDIIYDQRSKGFGAATLTSLYNDLEKL